jgi:hypothetical protein
MKNQKNNEWLDEFNEFVSQENVEVPVSLSERVLDRMESLINPDPKNVFAKILGIHLIVGFLSLAVCHQFDMNPFGTSFSLESVFMKMGGHNVCMIFCGVLFVGLSLSAAGFFLSIEEVRALKRTEFLQALSLGVISLGIFAFAGAELALTFAGLWLLGALIGGFVATETVWQIKRVFYS